MARYSEREYRTGEWFLWQRGSGWYRCRYDARTRQTERISLGVSDFEQAKQKLNRWWAENFRLASEETAPAGMPLASVILDYWAGQGSKLRSAQTVKIMLRYWNDFWGEANLADVKNPNRQDAFREWLTAKGLNQTSMVRCLEIGRAAIRRAWKRGTVSQLIHIEVPPIGETAPKGEPLSVEQARKLYQAADGLPHLRLFMILLAGTAARPEALFELKWDQVDFHRGIIRLNPPGRRQSSKRRPDVKMAPALAAYLLPLKGEGNVIKFRKKPIKKVDTGWHKLVKRSGVDVHVTPYSFRHTMARWMRAEGVSPWEVAAVLGHSLPGFSMTERYAAYDPQYQAAACASIERFLIALQLRDTPENQQAAATA
ncbi:MAG: site-specific integrase [Aquamicrobium sp.]|nr:site-specific integrase [Aquamicrobium sp.]